MSILVRNKVQLLGNQQADQTLVVAHGFGTDQTAWNNCTPAFFDNYRIALFDYVGANKKTVPYFNHRKYKQLYSYSDDILDIVEELDVRNVTFIGHSAGGISGTLAIAKLIFYADHRADITRLTHPALLIQGKEDVAVPVEISYFMEKNMPNADLLFIDTAGHLPHISGAQEVIKAIKTFLN